MRDKLSLSLEQQVQATLTEFVESRSVFLREAEYLDHYQDLIKTTGIQPDFSDEFVESTYAALFDEGRENCNYWTENWQLWKTLSGRAPSSRLAERSFQACFREGMEDGDLLSTLPELAQISPLDESLLGEEAERYVCQDRTDLVLELGKILGRPIPVSAEVLDQACQKIFADEEWFYKEKNLSKLNRLRQLGADFSHFRAEIQTAYESCWSSNVYIFNSSKRKFRRQGKDKRSL